MSGHDYDPVVSEARRRMRRAVPFVREAVKELQAAMRDLRQHPDFKASIKAAAAGKSARERVTLPWWYHGGIKNILEDAPLDAVAACIPGDLRNSSRTMEEFIRDEEEVLARRAAA